MSLPDEKAEALRGLVRAAMKVDECEIALEEAKSALEKIETQSTRDALIRKDQLVVVEVDGVYYTVVSPRIYVYEYERAAEAVV